MDFTQLEKTKYRQIVATEKLSRSEQAYPSNLPCCKTKGGTMTTRAKQLLDIQAAARHLAVKERFIRRLVAQRRVTYYKVGQFVRFDQADLDYWLDQCRIEKARN